MKQLFKLSISACLMAAFVFSGCKKDDDDNAEPAKKLKLLLSQTCEYVENGYNIMDKNEYKYDKSGKEIENLYTQCRDGVEIRSIKDEREYDSKGRQTKYVYTSVNEDGSINGSESDYKYDSNGNQIEYEYTSTQNGEIIHHEKSTTKYNKQGDRTECETIYERKNGNTTNNIDKWEYEYNGDGNKIKSNYYTNERLIETREYTYEGNTMNFTGIDYSSGNESTIKGSEEYVTINDIKLLKTYTYESAAYSDKLVYTYDNNARQIGLEHYSNGKLQYMYLYEGNTSINRSYGYDENGEISSSYITNAIYTDDSYEKPLTRETINESRWGNSTNKEEYTYDLEGNQTGYVYYINDKVSIENKDYVYEGNKVTYTSFDYRDGGSSLLTRYYTLIYSE